MTAAAATHSRDLTAVVDERLSINLHKGQAKAFRSEKRVVLVLAGTQGGKTSFGPVWLYNEIQRRGPGDYLVVAPTFPLLSLKLLPEFLRLFDKQLGLGKYTGSPSKKFVFSEAGARRTFGARFDPDTPTSVLFGHAQDPDSLESATVKAAWLDEAGQRKFKRASYEAILRRLAIHRGRILITTTPYYIGWLKKDLHDKAGKPGSDVELVQFRSVDNPVFSREEYEEMKLKLPPWKHAMFYDGRFTRPAGLIYDAYSYDTHTCLRFLIPAHWRRVWGFDFGAVHTACVKFAQDPDSGIWYAYGEYLAGSRIAAVHAEILLAGEPATPEAVGGAASEQNWRDEFTAAGLPIQKPPISDVEVGIDRVYALLATGRVMFFDDLPGLVGGEPEARPSGGPWDEGVEGRKQFRGEGELERYSRVLDDAGEPTDAIEDKKTFHLLDCARYFAALIEHPVSLPVVTTIRRRSVVG